MPPHASARLALKVASVHSPKDSWLRQGSRDCEKNRVPAQETRNCPRRRANHCHSHALITPHPARFPESAAPLTPPSNFPPLPTLKSIFSRRNPRRLFAKGGGGGNHLPDFLEKNFCCAKCQVKNFPHADSGADRKNGRRVCISCGCCSFVGAHDLRTVCICACVWVVV